MILPPDNITVRHRELIIVLAARHRIPAVYALREFVNAGGLMFYGAEFTDLFQRAASYVDRVLVARVRATSQCKHRQSLSWLST